MKLTKQQLKEMIREELSNVNESVSMGRVVDLLSLNGLDNTNWNEYIVHQYGEETVAAAKKLAPQIKKFEKNLANMLGKIINDKMYQPCLEFHIKIDERNGGYGRISFGDLLEIVARKNGIRIGLS